MDMTERIRRTVLGSGLKQKELAERIGVTPAAVNNWLNRGAEQVRPDVLFRLAEVTGKNPVWLATGEGPEMADKASKLRAPPIPIVGITQCGDEGYWEEFQYPTGHGDGAIEFPSGDPNAYALEVRGDSMEPRIRRGEYVIIEPNRAPEPGDEVLLVARDGRCMVKVFLYRRDGRIHLGSVNTAHAPISLDERGEVLTLHYVAGIAKRSLRVEYPDGEQAVERFWQDRKRTMDGADTQDRITSFLKNLDDYK